MSEPPNIEILLEYLIIEFLQHQHPQQYSNYSTVFGPPPHPHDMMLQKQEQEYRHKKDIAEKCQAIMTKWKNHELQGLDALLHEISKYEREKQEAKNQREQEVQKLREQRWGKDHKPPDILGELKQIFKQ